MIERELSVLRDALVSPRSELVVYGRRRVGKTYLLKYFLGLYGGLYLVINYSSRGLILRDLSRQLRREYGGGFGVFDTFRDLYMAAFSVAEKYSSKKPVLVTDEVQRLSGSGGLTELQYLWDNTLSYSIVLLILCGSGVGLIARSLLSYESPLYGRATRIIYLDSFSYRQAS